MAEEVIEVLRRTDLLGSAPGDVLQLVAASARMRSFGRGQVVFSRDDPSDTLIIVVSGRVKVTIRSADGGELILTIVTAGGVLGELSIADSGPRSADAQTVEESRLLLVPREVMEQVCALVPSVRQALAVSIAGTLRRLTEATADLVFLDLPRRLAKTLLTAQGPDGMIGPKISQQELARQIGGTRQSVNAALRGFQRRGWIEIRGQAISIRDPAALSRFTGELPPG